MKPCDCDQNRRQAALIKRLWVERCRDRKRIADQQRIIDKQRKPAPLTAQERAEKAFRGAENG